MPASPSPLDPYVLPGTAVLVNIPGLRTEAALRQYEYERSAMRLAELRLRPVEGRFDLDHLQRIHKHVFQDVYAWAGQLRTVNLSKGGSSFAGASQIGTVAAAVAQQLEREGFLRGLPKTQFVERFANYYAAWNGLHPFREGNGRSTREFLGQLAHQAGYTLHQTHIERDKVLWASASRQSMTGDVSALREIFSRAIRPTHSLALERLSPENALGRHPELKPAVDALAAARDSVAARYPGNKQTQEHFFAQARSEILRRVDTGQLLAGGQAPMSPSPYQAGKMASRGGEVAPIKAASNSLGVQRGRSR